MSILALDYGTKRIGLAVSDPLGVLARPLPFLLATSRAQLLQALGEIIRKEAVTLLLVGLPRNMDGSLGPAAERAQELIDVLKSQLAIDVRAVDERLSTVQASRLLREGGHDSRQQRGKIDSAAAAVLLQSYLDAQSPIPGDGHS